MTSTISLTAEKKQFLDLLLTSGALKFGSFKTKSGRMSPFFLNAGSFDHGQLLCAVAACYAHAINATFDGPFHLYGPAYKGITLAASTAMELARLSGQEVPFTFNRKEAKDHGEGGTFVGRCLRQDVPVVIVEDVMTGGTSIRETLELLTPLEIKVKGVVIGVDRQERGLSTVLASDEVRKVMNIPVVSILTLDQIVDALTGREYLGKIWITDDIRNSIDAYRAQWG